VGTKTKKKEVNRNRCENGGIMRRYILGGSMKKKNQDENTFVKRAPLKLRLEPSIFWIHHCIRYFSCSFDTRGITEQWDLKRREGILVVVNFFPSPGELKPVHDQISGNDLRENTSFQEFQVNHKMLCRKRVGFEKKCLRPNHVCETNMSIKIILLVIYTAKWIDMVLAKYRTD